MANNPNNPDYVPGPFRKHESDDPKEPPDLFLWFLSIMLVVWVVWCIVDFVQ